MKSIIAKINKNSFLFQELVKRDFKHKYKKTVLGVFWSLISPLLTLLVMAMVFSTVYGRDTPHFIIYLFAGSLNYTFYRQATSDGMVSLVHNASIILKIKASKYLFLLSKNVSSFINYLITLIIFFVFVAFDGIPFTWKFFMLIVPIICLLLFNIGTGMILSALYVFFRDMSYLYGVFTLLVMYLSAIFYNINVFPAEIQRLFLLNPVYVYINYFREVVIFNNIPSLLYNGLCLLYPILTLLLGSKIYIKYNDKFVFYL